MSRATRTGRGVERLMTDFGHELPDDPARPPSLRSHACSPPCQHEDDLPASRAGARPRPRSRCGE